MTRNSGVSSSVRRRKKISGTIKQPRKNGIRQPQAATISAGSHDDRVLQLSSQNTLLVTLLVAVTNFIWNPIGGAISDRIGRKPVLVTIAGLALVTVYPALSWLVTDPSFGKMLAVEMMLSFYFGTYSGAMLGALVEIVPKHVRTTCFSWPSHSPQLSLAPLRRLHRLG
ncbi:MFS family permease [Bradyrhizobium sp. LA2.1]